jgi:hypothetical protein
MLQLKIFLQLNPERIFEMPNDTDKARDEMMYALAAYKRADETGYNKLLASLNVKMWGEISASKFNEVTMTCNARTGSMAASDDNADDAEVVAELSDDEAEPANGNVQASLNALARKVFGKPIQPNDFADAAGGATSNADAMNKMGEWGNKSRRVAAARKANE